MNIGLYFGSFNPIHIGHLILANCMVQESDLDQVWFVVSPQSPFKRKSDLLHHFDRIDMVDKAIEGNSKLKSCDIEFSLPLPNYTIITLNKLIEKHPQHQFILVLGQDNLATFHKWKDYEEILAKVQLYCYPRPGMHHADLENHPKVKLIDAPLIEISSSHIRSLLAAGKSVQYLVPEVVEKMIIARKFYL